VDSCEKMAKCWINKMEVDDPAGSKRAIETLEKMKEKITDQEVLKKIDGEIYEQSAVYNAKIEIKLVSIFKVYFPDIAKLYIDNTVEYQRRKIAGQRVLFG